MPQPKSGSLLVTGATGNVGREVVRALLDRGQHVTAAARSTDAGHNLWGGQGAPCEGTNVRTVRLDFDDESTWRPALAGADRVFLMRPPAISNVRKRINPFIDLALAQGVDHIVFLSVAGAGSNRLVPHRKVEDHLRSCGASHTNLRPGFFAQNLQSAYRRDIIEDDRIYVPAGQHPVNWIDVRDIADVAAIVLAEPASHRGKSYTLAGPGPVEWSAVVEALSVALGRPIRYEAASVLGYVRHLSRRHLAPAEIAVQTVLHFLLRFGQGATEDPALERNLGRPGRSIEQYISDHADVWRLPSA